ncbi:hypothetical protein EDB85DRAFT_1902004 [Lactarius pseudohatsudake]|nr:hypothetical protein EDB85DRAFT_1902004 [Lactarius pseudohatsudake]
MYGLSGNQVAAVIIHVVVVLEELVPTETQLGQQPVARRTPCQWRELAACREGPVACGCQPCSGEGVAGFILPGGEQDSQHISEGALERYDIPRLTERYTFLYIGQHENAFSDDQE